MTKLDRQQMQGIDVMSLLYFDINLYHLRTKAGYKKQKFTCKYCEIVQQYYHVKMKNKETKLSRE